MTKVQEKAAQETNTVSLADAVWGDAPAPASATEGTPENGGGANGNPQLQQPQNTAEPQDEVVDADEYLRQNLGYQSWEEAKKEVEELKKLREAQSNTNLKFENEDSEKLFKALLGGKEEEVYEVLSRKKEFERLEKLDVSDPKQAEQVVFMSLRLKHPQLDEAEIRDIYNEQYFKYPKPVQDVTETDEEYAQKVEQWEAQNQAIDRKIVRDAKISKPEVLQLKTKIELPEIKSGTAAQSQQPSQEDLAQFEAQKQSFLNSANDVLKTFNGFTATVKDKDVEIPVSYDLSVEEKKSVQDYVQNFAENGLDANAIFANRWLNEDGSINAARMAKDIALLVCEDKLTQKYVNDAAAKRLEKFLAERKNIDVNGGQRETILTSNKETQMQAVQDFFWNQT